MTTTTNHVWIAQAFVEESCIERIVHETCWDAIHDIAICANEDGATEYHQWTKVAENEYTYESDSLLLTVDKHRVYSGA